MALIRKSRIVRKNQMLAAFLERKEEYDEAKRTYDASYAKLVAEATRVLKLYAPLKNAVSDRNWNGKIINKLKVTKSGRVIDLVLHQSGSYGYEHESFWEFPSWMIGATDDRIVEGLQKIIEEDSVRFAKKEQERQERIRAADLAKLEELKKKYSENENVVS